MIITIHQPDFMPWLGFFDRWNKSNLFVVLDDVQFIRRGWHNRDRIRTRDGSLWLTVPVLKKERYHQMIGEVMIDESTNWRAKHLKTIETLYKHSPSFDYYFEKIRSVYNEYHSKLIDLNMDILYMFGEALSIKTPVMFSSRLGIRSKSAQRLVDIVTVNNGTGYLTGQGAKGYLDESLFNKKGIRVIWQQYDHPVYQQRYGGFVPMLSTLDYLMMSPMQDREPAVG